LKSLSSVDLILGRVPGRRCAQKIALYQSLGVGLQDVALAGLAWRKLQGHQGESL